MQIAFIRFMLVVAFFIFWIGAVSVRLVHLQVNEHGKWKKKAFAQRQDKVDSKSLRGTIYDRNGNALAMSVRVKSLSADPAMVENPERLALYLGKLLKINPREITAAIRSGKENNRRFVWIAREIDDAKVLKIKETIFDKDAPRSELATGLFWVGEQKREYPHGKLAAHVIGFSNSDDIGQAGIEKSQEPFLKAERLLTRRHRDRQGRVFAETELESTPSKDVVLTISKEIQHIAERSLESGVKAAGARSGKVIVMDPKSGEIYALANYPTFDPTDFRKLRPGIWRNSAIQDQYAPGSIFKLVTYSAAVEEGLAMPEKELDCGDGTITVGGYTFNDSHAVGKVTYSDAMAQSSNVGAIKTALAVGKDKYYRYARDFGFGKPTGVGLPSEAQGVLRTPKTYKGPDLASMSIGYGIDVTALQSAVAFATIANNGVRVTPRIVKSVQQDGKKLQEFENESHRVIRSETAAALKAMLREVVASGTAKRARLNGYTSAGKTGTAWKYDPRTGGINSNKYISSFIGFAPADNPAVVVAVVIDEPRGSARYGGHVAAPVFREIAESILPELRVAPDGPYRDEILNDDNPVKPGVDISTAEQGEEDQTDNDTQKPGAKKDASGKKNEKSVKAEKQATPGGPANPKKMPKSSSSYALKTRLIRNGGKVPDFGPPRRI